MSPSKKIKKPDLKCVWCAFFRRLWGECWPFIVIFLVLYGVFSVVHWLESQQWGQIVLTICSGIMMLFLLGFLVSLIVEKVREIWQKSKEDCQ